MRTEGCRCGPVGILHRVQLVQPRRRACIGFLGCSAVFLAEGKIAVPQVKDLYHLGATSYMATLQRCYLRLFLYGFIHEYPRAPGDPMRDILLESRLRGLGRPPFRLHESCVNGLTVGSHIQNVIVGICPRVYL